MAFAHGDWIDVTDELPEKKIWVLLACTEEDLPFLALGFLEEVDKGGFPHFYTLSHGWVDVLYWQELPLHPELYEDY